MSRRWIQSTVIVLVFLAGFIAVILLGADRGKTGSLNSNGVPLSEKPSWEEALAAVPDRESTTVFVTKSGTKYHLSDDCSGLTRAKEIIKTTLSAAEADGKELCKICEG